MMNKDFPRKFWRQMVIFHIIPILLILFLFIGAFFFVGIPSARESLMDARRDKIKDLTQVAWNILEEYQHEASLGEITQDTAQQEARIRLETIRYGPELKDYFWISNMEHTLVMHPYRKDLIGVNLYDFQDPGGTYLFRDFRDLVKARGEGFSQYMWQRNDNTNHVVSKVSYVKGFKPWGWIVGTGIYLDEVEQQITHITANARNAFIIITGVMILIGLYVIYHSYQAELAKLHALEKVRSSEIRFRAIYDDSVQCIGLLDLEGRLLDANKTSLRMVDSPFEEMENKKFWETAWWSHDVDSQQRLKEGIKKCAQGETVHFEVTNKNNADELIYIDFSLKPIFDLDGDVVQMIPEGRDITERKKFEAELAQKNKELSDARTVLMTAIDNSPVGIIIADAPNLKVRIVNSAAHVACGVEDRSLCDVELKGHEAKWKTYTADGVPCAFDELPLTRAVLQGAKSENVELLFEHDSGERRRVISNAAPIRDVNGNIVSGIVVFLDVTEESALRERLAHTDKMDSIGQLAGGIAHDFNNMLTGILGGAELLDLEFEGNPSAKSSIEMIKTSSKRAADLTKQLLTFSRKKPSIVHPVNVHDLVEQTILILKRSIDKRITIETNLIAVESNVMGDSSMLHNAILNLCINARDAMLEGGTLSISTEIVTMTDADCINNQFEIRAGEFLKIEVSDTGEGMEQTTLRRIFDPFFTTKEVGKGTGLGLAAVYGTVKNHDGAIFAESEIGKGASFKLLLPLYRESQQAQNSKDANQVVFGSGCVLVVDDEKVVRHIAQSQLEIMGYDVLVASDGELGLELYKEKADQIDMVILDVVMPNMSGADCANAILQQHEDAKILLWSGYTRNESIKEILSRLNCSFIHKPCDMVELSHAVATLLQPEKVG